MSISESKRQKQLARKKKKRQEKKSDTALKASDTSCVIKNAAQASRFPIYECLVPDSIFEEGIGMIVVSRKLDHGKIGISVILLDVWCLGAKNAYFRVVTSTGYQETLRSINTNERLQKIHLVCARKLVEDCVDYAKALGFDPHPDYEVAKPIFGDIDPAECSEIYTFGQDGQPCFIAGPNDSPQRCKKIMNTLEKSCSPDGFHYIIGMPSL